MYVSSVFLDRFGTKANIRLDNLVDGLNVVCGPAGSGKTTLVDFLRAMWNGFDSRLRDQYLPVDSRGFGGSFCVTAAQGRQTICRYDDGGPEGRLTVEREDGAIIGRRDLRDLIGDISSTLLERAFLVDFQRRPRLADLLATIASRGFAFDALTENSASLRAFETRLAEKRALLAQLNSASGESRRLQSSPDLALHSGTVDQTAVGNGASNPLDQLATLDAQLARWKQTLREVVARKLRASERSDSRQLGAAAAAASNVVPRRRLRALETRIQELQQSVVQLGSDQHCVCQAIRSTLGESLQSMRDEVYQLCNDLNHWQSHYQRRKAVGERDQLARCERELRQSIHSLSERRQVFMQRMMVQGPAVCRHPDHSLHCQCAGHPQALRPVNGARVKPVVLDRSVADEERRRELQREIRQLEEECRRLRDSADSSDLIRTASHFLRRLSSDEWLQIDAVAPQDVWITGTQGRRLRYDELDSGAKDQVYLAICLAAVAACDRDGVRVPMVINAPFAHYPAKQVSAALEVLRDVGRNRQILCLTRHEHVVGLARLLNVPIHALASQPDLLAVRSRTETIELPELRPLPLATHHRTDLAASPHIHTSKWDAEEFPGELTDRVRYSRSREARPIAPVDRSEVPLPSSTATPIAKPFEPTVRSEYYLSEHDPIERVPYIDEANISRLRTLRILRVGDLLRAAASQCAADLHSWGISRELVQTWQAQARLLCYVRRLRPYDARILVACGITDPEQLTAMSSAALRSRVKEFAASAKGQAVLSSGTESELSSVMEWVQLARGELSPDWTRPETVDRPERTERVRATKLTRRRQGAHPNGSLDTANKNQSATTPTSPLSVEDGLRFRLKRSDFLVDAPSIGPGMAKRMEKLGIILVDDLLNASADSVASRLQMNRVTAVTVREWQQQAALVCRVPRLRGKDARVLVSVGVTNAEQLAAMDPTVLWQRVQPYCNTQEGKRLLRNGTAPTATEVAGWIQAARQSRTMNAA